MNTITRPSPKTLTPSLILSLATLFATCYAQAGWPTHRGDAARSGYTDEPLPEKLSLIWEHRGHHRPQPSWPRQDRLPFDRVIGVSYRPVGQEVSPFR